jgi:nitroreductase
MSQPPLAVRIPEAQVDCQFLDRWSPRAFMPGPLPETTIASLFEAARWAPSCMNEQPWLFVYATTPMERARMVRVLAPRNQEWASQAPLLMLLLTRVKFARRDRANRHAAFDAGAAWMSLALQARRLGLYAHAMAGFSQEQAYELLAVSPEDYEIMAAIAVGAVGDPATLPEHHAANEQPSDRKPAHDVARRLGEHLE